MRTRQLRNWKFDIDQGGSCFHLLCTSRNFHCNYNAAREIFAASVLARPASRRGMARDRGPQAARPARPANCATRENVERLQISKHAEKWAISRYDRRRYNLKVGIRFERRASAYASRSTLSAVSTLNCVIKPPFEDLAELPFIPRLNIMLWDASSPPTLFLRGNQRTSGSKTKNHKKILISLGEV